MSVRDGITQHYSLKVPPEGQHQPWTTQVVMSTLPADILPSSLNKSGAQRLCTVKSRLPQNMKLKNDKWYQRADSYYKAEFDVRVLIGAADLRFQTLDQSGLLSQDHASIDIDWQASQKSVSTNRPDVPELSTAISPIGQRAVKSGGRSGFRASEMLMNRFSRHQ